MLSRVAPLAGSILCMREFQRLLPIDFDGTGACRFRTARTGLEPWQPREIGPCNYIRKGIRTITYHLPVFHIPHQESDTTRLQYASNFLRGLVIVGVAPVPGLGGRKMC